MKTVPLSNSDKTVKVDDEDYEKIASHRWCLSNGLSNYPLIRTSQKATKTKKASELKKISIHRMIMGDGPKSIDHINGDPFDNRRENLRPCSHAQNMRNKRKRSDSKNKYKGVYRKDRYGKILYQAQLAMNGKLVYSGYFKSEKAAAIAYDLAAKSWHGEFASCNILSNGSF